MKKRLLMSLATLLFWGVSLLAQDVPEGVIAAFRKGSSQELKAYLIEQVELMMDSRKVCSEREATLTKLGDFFAHNKVQHFDMNHQGKRGESSFVIGTLTTANGKYRVNCYFKRLNDTYIVHQIRIDKTNG